MSSSSARVSAAALLLLVVFAPRPAVGQDKPKEFSPGPWLCPMPVVGISPGAARGQMERFRRLLDGDSPAGATEPCVNPLTWQFGPAARNAVIRLPEEGEPFYWPVPEMFGGPDSLPLVVRPPRDSVPRSPDSDVPNP